MTWKGTVTATFTWVGSVEFGEDQPLDYAEDALQAESEARDLLADYLASGLSKEEITNGLTLEVEEVKA